ncbi:glycogen synthase [Deinococcus roseus]|nr:glycogen synthase [Deinococcus roseus]
MMPHSKLHVLHVSTEVFPFSRTGGLADVAGALPYALQKHGHTSSTLSPWYETLQTPHPPEVIKTFHVHGIGNVNLGQVVLDGVSHYFLNFPLVHTPKLYGYENDPERFARFCLASMHALLHLPHVDVLHAHDWGVGLLPAMIQYAAPHPRLHGISTAFTIHNLQHQGRWNPQDVLSWTHLPSYLVHPDGVEFFGDVNYIKSGIRYADVVTTVSPTYAQEVTTPTYGEGLDGILRQSQYQGKLRGILNGLDTDRWDPRTDPDIVQFSDYAGKQAARDALRQEFGFDDKPILAAVTRLATQKGLDLILPFLQELLQDWNLLILGGGDANLEGIFTVLDEHVPSFKFRSGMQEALSHRIYAGADAFLMPSRFEPCGLSQMISMRYGTVPIVRDTGGLHDTVPPHLGFRFRDATPQALRNVLKEARGVYEDRGAWEYRAQEGMKQDFSWEKAAAEYIALYRTLLED